MATKPIKLTILLATLILVTVIEWFGAVIVRQSDLSPWFWIIVFRLIQTAAILFILIQFGNGLAAIQWEPNTWPRGLKKGAVWSIWFGLAAGCAMLVVYLTGRNPLPMLRSPLPREKADLILFFIAGGLIAPIAEEICFRGILFRYFRRWGFWLALLASTLLFVALHSSHSIPFTQIVGGLVFAAAYEITENLMVPITIHSLGNLAIFAISLL